MDLALRLQHHRKWGASARLVVWAARVYLGDQYAEDAMKMKDVLGRIENSHGGPGAAEVAWLTTISNPTVFHKIVDALFDLADAQHGVLVTWHPTAILRLAEFALAELKDSRTAVLLTSIALGFTSTFVSLADVNRLARLLMALNAPVCLWADWSSVLICHIQVATTRIALIKSKARNISDVEGLVFAAEEWALAEDEASEEVVRSVLAAGPNEAWAILQSLAPHMNAPKLGRIVENTFSPNPLPGWCPGEALWSEPKALRYRYFWYDMIASNEQDLVRNGDWAMFGLPTGDFSMALAQWWRTLESVLKRDVVGLLSSRFAEQPELAQWDRQNLSEKKQKEESVFLDKLAVPDRCAKLTLYDILLVLKKCESMKEGDVTGSRLRCEAARVLKEYSVQIGPLTQATWFRPAHLTDQNINWFRNRASHDSAVDFFDAATGRILAKRILDGYFAPVLKSWGFSAPLP